MACCGSQHIPLGKKSLDTAVVQARRCFRVSQPSSSRSHPVYASWRGRMASRASSTTLLSALQSVPSI